MAPRGHVLPEATTESARAARKSFFCELCQKGYARMTDFEAHEGSYDHQHRKRLKEMKQLTRDPNAAAKAERERKANEATGLKPISLSTAGAGSGSGVAKGKKPVFKSTLQPQNAAVTSQEAPIDLPSTTGTDANTPIADEGNDQFLREITRIISDKDYRPTRRELPQRPPEMKWKWDEFDAHFGAFGEELATSKRSMT